MAKAANCSLYLFGLVVSYGNNSSKNLISSFVKLTFIESLFYFKYFEDLVPGIINTSSPLFNIHLRAIYEQDAFFFSANSFKVYNFCSNLVKKSLSLYLGSVFLKSSFDSSSTLNFPFNNPLKIRLNKVKLPCER